MEKKFKTLFPKKYLNAFRQRNLAARLFGRKRLKPAKKIVSVCEPILKQMRKKLKKYLITTEQREIFIMRRQGKKPIRGFCPECRTEVELLTFDAATNISGISWRTLVRGCESGRFHTVEPADGHLLICRYSIAKS